MTSSTVTSEVDQIRHSGNAETLVMSDATFVLRNVLEVPEVKLEGYLKQLTGPEVNCKMKLCGSCADEVTTAKRIYQEMIDAQKRFKDLKFKISRKVVLSEQGIVCGDKEPDFLMTFVNEIANNHGRENLASPTEESDVLNHGSSDTTDKQEGIPEAEVDHVTTKSQAENVGLIGPELAGGIDMPNVGDLNAESPTTSATVVNEPWLNTEPKLEDLLLLDQYVEAIAEPEVSKTEGSTAESGTEEDDCMLEFENHFNFKEEPQCSSIVTLNSQDFVNTMETGNSSDENESDEEGFIADLLKTPKAKAGTSKMELQPQVPKPKRKKKAPKFCLLPTAKDPNAPHGLVIKGLKRIPKALEGPVQCKCGTKFTNTGHLRRHVKESLVNEKDHFRCEICFKGKPSKLVTFKREENLRWHVKMVHEKYRRPCPKCGKLMYPKNFNRHLKRCGMKNK